MDNADPSLHGREERGAGASDAERGLATLFAKLYRAHFAHVWHTLRRVGVPRGQLEDATHDVFVVVHRRLSDFDAPRPARPWLAGIAVRVAADRRRKAYRRRETPAAPEDLTLKDPGCSPERNAQRSEDHRVVAAALATLPPEQRAVFVMHEIDGFGMPEIAEALRAPLNTCYSRLRLARRRFAEAARRRAGARGTR